ncbi:ATP synthase protein I [Candidatus Rhodobacter oscarellae]|uniref:ATP synthase protein I n=1 Tax=Candidatus Rhodobacter oscarellae TaxID=1675527 RepID=A0A0J9EFQ3_9RHOB|nr:AtpZ/AtpI family protein [Candidatus Rhodobacter lobularis]KMW60509.1 ATP synthase protein I [Candidatus Rhodobacter lobularis]
MADPVDKAQLERLEARITAMKTASAPRPKIEEHHSQAHLAWRMVIELVAGIVIGFGLGYGLDWVLGTLPLFLVIMTLLGFVAGVRTMLRSAQEIQETENAGPVPATDEDKTRG